MATRRKVIVIGAGMGGLVAALLSAAHGFDTLVLERAAAPGGKLRELEVEGVDHRRRSDRLHDARRVRGFV